MFISTFLFTISSNVVLGIASICFNVSPKKCDTANYGNTAAASQSPLAGNISTTISSVITGLASGTTYHFRVKANNSLGTTNGSDMTFTTDPITISDVEGNIYNVVRIGTQVWMKENLKSTKYNDNSDIPLVADQTAWNNIQLYGLETPAYCWYNNDETNKAAYSGLYNWYTLNTSTNGNKNVCPSGWHVPVNDDWVILIDYLTNNGYG